MQAASFDVRFGISPEQRELIFDIQKLQIRRGMPYVSRYVFYMYVLNGNSEQVSKNLVSNQLPWHQYFV
jgi:hypothetical protein